VRLLVTRPQEDAEALKERLAALGHEGLAAPLLDIRFKSDVPLRRDGVQAILATSANGVRAFAGRADLAVWLDVPLLAVGPTTAALAKETGFEEVYEGDGDAVALAALARKLCQPGKGRLIHVSGAVIAGDLKAWLKKDGFETGRAVLYEAAAADRLPAAARAALQEGALDGVLLYSRRTAGIFKRLCEAEGLLPALQRLSIFCLAPGIAQELAGVQVAEIEVAAQPNEEALLKLLD